MAKKTMKLGEMLLSAGIIDDFQLNSALSHQRNLGGRLGSSLIKLGYVSEEKLLSFLADQLNCPRIDLDHMEIPADVLAFIPEDKARQFNVVPVARREMSGTVFLIVAISDPTNLEVIDSLQFMTGCRIRPGIATGNDIQRALRRWYGPGSEEAPQEVEPLEDENELTVELGVVRSTEEKYQALLAKLHELGILSRTEFEELR